MSFWNAEIPARTYVPVFAIVAVFAAISFVEHMPASPPAPLTVEQQQKQQNAERFDELAEKQRLSYQVLPNTHGALNAGPSLTYDECMYVHTYNGGNFDGDHQLAELQCRPEHYSEPSPRPVFVVPNPD
jgi:hypothetical protein